MPRVTHWSKRRSRSQTIGLVVLLLLITASASFAPLPMDWRRPHPQDIAAGKWKIKPLTSGGHKGLIRVRTIVLDPDQQYKLRVTVTRTGSQEESMIETPPLTTEIEKDS
jgi:hypothetical protein